MEWMPGLRIDRSRAIGLCEELSTLALSRPITPTCSQTRRCCSSCREVISRTSSCTSESLASE